MVKAIKRRMARPSSPSSPRLQFIREMQLYIAGDRAIAIVASLETLLNLEAVDKLDLKTAIPTKSELIRAQGVGNAVGGLIGSLPVTSVIIRSSVNIHVGVETKKSTIIHGIFLVLSVAVFATYLNYIPFTSLAAILLMTGWKLANPKLFRSLWKKWPSAIRTIYNHAGCNRSHRLISF